MFHNGVFHIVQLQLIHLPKLQHNVLPMCGPSAIAEPLGVFVFMKDAGLPVPGSHGTGSGVLL